MLMSQDVNNNVMYQEKKPYFIRTAELYKSLPSSIRSNFSFNLFIKYKRATYGRILQNVCIPHANVYLY